MQNIQIGNKVFETELERDELEGIGISPGNKYLIRLLKELAYAQTAQVRQYVIDGKLHEAAMEEGFTEAVEGVIDFLENDLVEQIEKK